MKPRGIEGRKSTFGSAMESVMLRYKNTRASTVELIDKILNRDSTVVLGFQEEMAVANMPLRDSRVGRELQSGIEKERERYEITLSRVREEMEESNKKRDYKASAILEEVKKKISPRKSKRPQAS